MTSSIFLQSLLILKLKDTDSAGNDLTSQIRNRVSFVVETARISELLLDLKEVTFINSESIGQLITLKKKCDQAKISFAICNISPQNMKVLRMVRCDEIVDVFDNKKEAVKSLAKKSLPVPGVKLTESEVAILTGRANTGDDNAMFELARRLADGDGVEQDPESAVGWFAKAAEHGHVEAQHELATCYAFGQGVPQNYGLAMPWYQKAARKGNPDSQYMYAMSYQYALKDVHNLKKAKKWYTRAAEQGHEKAKLALVEMEQADAS